MKVLDDTVLFIGDCSYWSTIANTFLLSNFSNVDTVFWESGMAQQNIIDRWKGDWIFSFKSDLILPKRTLCNAKKGAINFHPAPPKYRGIGGYYYSIKNQDSTFGVTCHHMDSKIDHGGIIKVSCFDVLPNDNNNTVREKAAAYCLTLFDEIVSMIAKSQSLPCSELSWGEKLYTKNELKEYIKQNELISV